MTFSKITRPRIKMEIPSLPRGELNRELGRRWRDLSEEQKRQWVPSRLEGNASSSSAMDAGTSTLSAGDTEDEEEGEEAVVAPPANSEKAPIVEM